MNRCFLVAQFRQMVRRQNLEVAPRAARKKVVVLVSSYAWSCIPTFYDPCRGVLRQLDAITDALVHQLKF